MLGEMVYFFTMNKISYAFTSADILNACSKTFPKEVKNRT